MEKITFKEFIHRYWELTKTLTYVKIKPNVPNELRTSLFYRVTGHKNIKHMIYWK